MSEAHTAPPDVPPQAHDFEFLVYSGLEQGMQRACCKCCFSAPALAGNSDLRFHPQPPREFRSYVTAC